MRRQWFGDSRDYVKWSCIRREAQDGFIVIYGAMLRPDSFNDSALDSNVVDFFDRLKNFTSLSELFPNGFVVEDSVYTKQRADEYFRRIIQRIANVQVDKRILVFLDPDTGMQPKGKLRDEHLRERDIRAIAAVLKPGDKLVIYQHALHASEWMTTFEKRLVSLCAEMATTLSEPFHAPGVVKDVCFFTLIKVDS